MHSAVTTRRVLLLAILALTAFQRPSVVTENIAKGLFTPGETVDRWMASSGHRKNILLRRATATGLGVALGPGEEECVDVLWVQLFAG